MQVPRRNSNLDAPRFACGLTSISCLFGVLVPDAARDRAALASLLRARAPRAPGEMHSFWQRLNALFFFALSVLGFLSFSAAGTTYWHESNPQISLTAHKEDSVKSQAAIDAASWCSSNSSIGCGSGRTSQREVAERQDWRVLRVENSHAEEPLTQPPQLLVTLQMPKQGWVMQVRHPEN